jgi:hypothetical protein
MGCCVHVNWGEDTKPLLINHYFYIGKCDLFLKKIREKSDVLVRWIIKEHFKIGLGYVGS